MSKPDTMRKPKPGDIVHCIPERGLHFYVMVEDAKESQSGEVFLYGPIRQEAMNYHWDGDANGESFRPAPHSDGDYIVTDPAEYDRVWADYAATRLTGE